MIRQFTTASAATDIRRIVFLFRQTINFHLIFYWIETEENSKWKIDSRLTHRKHLTIEIAIMIHPNVNFQRKQSEKHKRRSIHWYSANGKCAKWIVCVGALIIRLCKEQNKKKEKNENRRMAATRNECRRAHKHTLDANRKRKQRNEVIVRSLIFRFHVAIVFFWFDVVTNILAFYFSLFFLRSFVSAALVALVNCRPFRLLFCRTFLLSRTWTTKTMESFRFSAIFLVAPKKRKTNKTRTKATTEKDERKTIETDVET